MNEREYLLTDWRKYSILVESEYERKNEMLDYLRTIRYEIRANNVYLKDEHRPKSYDDIYKLIPYKDLGKKELSPIYILENNQPKRIMVKVLETDGKTTTVESNDLKVDDELIISQKSDNAK